MNTNLVSPLQFLKVLCEEVAKLKTEGIRCVLSNIPLVIPRGVVAGTPDRRLTVHYDQSFASGGSTAIPHRITYRFSQRCSWKACYCKVDFGCRLQRSGSHSVCSDASFISFTGVLSCLDGFMNIALEQTEEHVNGVVTNRYGDAFIRGNNGQSHSYRPRIEY